MLRLCLLSFLVILCVVACEPGKEKKENAKSTVDYLRVIPGQDEPIPAKAIQKGKVLIAYSDCYTCHKEEERSFGPAFKDVARRYPANKLFQQMLAQKIIAGGKGSWGNAVMLAHPRLSVKDAEDMAAYILSLDR
ncbi:cytochrome C [Mucilaginibacter hurinus]|uniref:Cytochrome C n=1 Tax=Mucilaginibacter hurinus TaxID=2201324 RepID=A0A367GN29_9SPHI|nr:c-type cytochrome [Mucilaginibacter hurinus]RCH54438.1 cytochrome C [Mucilaginibacter hurinus]